jgi:hypothetical protein
MFEVLPHAELRIVVSEVNIFRFKEGPDNLELTTNRPSVTYPFTGLLKLHLTTTRNTGEDWVQRTLGERMVCNVFDWTAYKKEQMAQAMARRKQLFDTITDMHGRAILLP